MSVQKSKQVKDYFYKLTDTLINEASANESISYSLFGEDTQFIRFNQSKVRQATKVQQYTVDLQLIKDNKKLNRSVNITFDYEQDYKLCLSHLMTVKKQINSLPEFNSVVEPQSGESSEQILESNGYDGAEGIDEILAPLQSVDMAGIFASGPIYRGVNNSKGLKHWFSNDSFYLDYSMYSAKQRAVKSGYAGNSWDNKKYLSNLETSKDLLSKMNLPVVNVPKGQHRVYLAPGAVAEIMGTMSWGAFSMGSYQKGHSPLKKLKDGEEVFSKKFNVQENFELGLSPQFNSVGEFSSPVVNLINKGDLESFLISSVTAKEFNLESNYANSYEAPRSLLVKPGQLSSDNILKELGTGIYICNLHYLNWSDAMSARITGMTRFACLWVENGEIKGPIKDLRFDESLYNCFGNNLVDLTAESEVIAETMSYSIRHLGGMSVPGMIVNDFNFTL